MCQLPDITLEARVDVANIVNLLVEIWQHDKLITGEMAVHAFRGAKVRAHPYVHVRVRVRVVTVCVCVCGYCVCVCVCVHVCACARACARARARARACARAIPSHPIPSHPNPSHPIPSYPIPSHASHLQGADDLGKYYTFHDLPGVVEYPAFEGLRVRLVIGLDDSAAGAHICSPPTQ